jgi:hypothetical protein
VVAARPAAERRSVMPTRQHISTRQFGVDQPLRSCIERIATRCSLDCCGIDACKVTPLMLELWSDSVGKEKTRTAMAQAADIVRLCDDSGGEALSCDFLNFRELCEPATQGNAERSEFELVQDEERRRVREFFASLVDGLRTYA